MRRYRLWSVLALLTLLTGCRPLVETEETPLSIYATFYPIYALTEAVMRDVPDAELHCLVQPQDGCLRAYAISDWDAYLLASADAVICGGRGLESFESLLFQWGKSGPAVSAVLYNLELYEGKATGDREDSHLDGPNPHLYLSLEGAKRMIEGITGSMMALDPRYGDRYAENEEKAMAALNALSDQIQTEVGHLKGRKIALMHEALIYPAKDLGLEIVDWIDRESGEGLYGDALTACADRVKASGAEVVLIEQQAPAALIAALHSASIGVARLDTLSTGREGQGFDHYMEALQNNARAVARAFEEIEG